MQEGSVRQLRSQIDMPRAMARVNAIQMPIFVIARDRDHNQATFRLAYELMRDAGKPAEWKSYDHDYHGFIFIQRDNGGNYHPDLLQREVVEDSIAFFDRNL